MAFTPGDRVIYVGYSLPDFKGKTGSVVPHDSNGQYATRVKFDDEAKADLFLTENLELISSAEEHKHGGGLPKISDGRSIAIAQAKNGGVSVSILGQPSFELDSKNAIFLSDYLRSSVKHSVKKWVDSL